MHKFQDGFSISKFIFISESFGDRPRDPESEGTNEAITPLDYTLSDEETARLDHESSVRQAQSTEFDKHHAEEFSSFEANYGPELDAAYGLEEVDKEETTVEAPLEGSALPETNDAHSLDTEVTPVLPPQQRYELRQEALRDSFVGDHLIGNLPEVSSGRLWERSPDDHWSLQTLKAVVNVPTATIANGLIIVEDVAKFGWEVLKGGYNLVTEPKETWGKITNFFRPGMGERLGNWWDRTKEDFSATVENTPWEGLVGKTLAFAADTILGAKGISKLAKMRKAPNAPTAAAEVTAESANETARLARLNELVRQADDIIPFHSPEYAQRLTQLQERLSKISPENIRRIEGDFLNNGVERGWFTEVEGRKLIDQEFRRLTERLERGDIRLTNNLRLENLSSVFESGGLKAKYQLDNPDWLIEGAKNERLKRARIEADLGIDRMSPKYAGLESDMSTWGEVEFVFDLDRVRERTSFTHLDSFIAGASRNNPSSAQLTLEDALRSRAILNVEQGLIKAGKREGYDDPTLIYTETQILGEARIGQEIKEIVVPHERRTIMEKILKRQPQYRRFITYK